MGNFSFRPLGQTLLIVSCFYVFAPSLKAQSEASLVNLIERVEALEEEVRNLHGQLDESRHEVSVLKNQVEAFHPDTSPVPSVDLSESPVLSLPEVGHEKRETFSTPPSSLTPEEAYEQARAFLENGDYSAAEKALSSFVETYPKHALAGASLYWLGVTHFVQKQYEKAAAYFAKVYRNYPKSSKVPDGLLKLAKSLKELGRKADACTALDQLAKDFPKAFPQDVALERKKYGCG